MPSRHPLPWKVLATLAAAAVAVPAVGTDLPPEISFIGNFVADPSFEQAEGMWFRSLGCAPDPLSLSPPPPPPPPRFHPHYRPCRRPRAVPSPQKKGKVVAGYIKW